MALFELLMPMNQLIGTINPFTINRLRPLRPLIHRQTPGEGNLRPASSKLTDRTIHRCPFRPLTVRYLGKATWGCPGATWACRGALSMYSLARSTSTCSPTRQTNWFAECSLGMFTRTLRGRCCCCRCSPPSPSCSYCWCH